VGGSATFVAAGSGSLVLVVGFAIPVADATGGATAAELLELAGLTFSELEVPGFVSAVVGAVVGRLPVETLVSGELA